MRAQVERECAARTCLHGVLEVEDETDECINVANEDLESDELRIWVMWCLLTGRIPLGALTK